MLAGTARFSTTVNSSDRQKAVTLRSRARTVKWSVPLSVPDLRHHGSSVATTMGGVGMPEPTPPAGWYQDPTSATPQLRFWDGSAWTPRYRAYDPPQVGASKPASPQGRGSPRRRARWKGIKWGALGIFTMAAGFAAYALLSGQPLREVNLSTGQISFYASDDPEQIEEIQPEAESAVADLTADARQESATEAEFSGPDLSGSWYPAGGSGMQWYVVRQYGAQVVVQEMTPWGITAAGSGTVTDGLLDFTFTAYDGNVGRGELRIRDSSTLEGTLISDVYGEVPVIWQRVPL